MIEFDKHAGKHFSGKRVRTSIHAREEAMKEFRVERYAADDWIKEQLSYSQFIGSIYAADGKQVRLFGYKRIAFILAADTDLVITIYARHIVDEALRNPLEELVKSVVKHASARLAVKEKEFKETVGTLRRLRAVASDNEVMNCIDEEIKKQEESLHEMRQEHAKLLKGVVAYV
jgi:Asp-tRNA(Asn)/Glu-tRNA(Gln) amidotransferase B subunit